MNYFSMRLSYNEFSDLWFHITRYWAFLSRMADIDIYSSASSWDGVTYTKALVCQTLEIIETEKNFIELKIVIDNDIRGVFAITCEEE